MTPTPHFFCRLFLEWRDMRRATLKKIVRTIHDIEIIWIAGRELLRKIGQEVWNVAKWLLAAYGVYQKLRNR